MDYYIECVGPTSSTASSCSSLTCARSVCEVERMDDCIDEVRSEGVDLGGRECAPRELGDKTRCVVRDRPTVRVCEVGVPTVLIRGGGHVTARAMSTTSPMSVRSTLRPIRRALACKYSGYVGDLASKDNSKVVATAIRATVRDSYAVGDVHGAVLALLAYI